MRILIVEDEPYLIESMVEGLRREGFSVDPALDGDTALELLSQNSYDAVVLDRDVPGPTGDEIARWVIDQGIATRMIMVTAADRLDDKVTGFELGVDDYLTKPFMLRELSLRLRALVRRPADARPPVLELHGVRLDPYRKEVARDDTEVRLTRKQFAVLELLMRADGGVLSAEDLLSRAWDENADPFSNTVRITISSVRKKLGNPWLIQTRVGVGYWFGPAEQVA